MTWFILSLIAILFWSGSDLFSKLGSRPDAKYSPWKMVMAVGVVMGAHAFFLIATGTPFSISAGAYTHLDVYKRQSYENQTKKAITNKFIQQAMTEFLKHNLEVYLSLIHI